MTNLLAAVVGLVLTGALAGCGEVDGGTNTSAVEIREREATWRAAAIDDYVLDYKVRCHLCLTKDRRVRVLAGRIERVDYKAVTRPTQDNAQAHWFHDPTYFDEGHSHYDEDYVFTVESLFSLSRNGHERAYAITVIWHELGFPAEVLVDWEHNGIDDEIQILVTRFERL